MLNPVLINPAFVGNEDALATGLVSKIQFLGTESQNPIQNTIFAHSPLVNRSIAFGTILSYDVFGPQNNFSGNIIAAKKIKIKSFKFSFAGNLGYVNHRLNFTTQNTNPLSSETALSDPVLNNLSNNKFNLGLGINVQYKYFFIGANIPTVIFSSTEQSPLLKNYFFNQIQFYGGLNYRISDDILLKPSFLIRSLKGSGIQSDVNLLLNLFDKYTAGISYKHNIEISAIMMIKLTKQFSVSYSYDYITSNLATASKGNHELQLKYVFKYYVNDMNVKKIK